MSVDVAILGTGALAMLFGAHLNRAGVRVCLLGTWPDGLEAIRDRGIELVEGGSQSRHPVAVVDLASCRPEHVPGAPLVLVLVKAYATAAVAPWAAGAAAAGGTVLTLQNGLGNAEVLKRARARTAVGATTRGARVLGPGRVHDCGGGATVLARGDDDIAAVLAGAGFEIRLSDRIERDVWLKVAVNCAINPLTALHGVPNGTLLEDPELRRHMIAAAREVAAVACARGVELDADPAAKALEVAARTTTNRSSMLQDVDRGARTEIDALCGAVVRLGEDAAVATPVNGDLWQRIQELDGVGAGCPALSRAARRVEP